jgi:phosphohistidine phosphatase
MNILIFRHGIAEAISADGDDASRPLTRDGITKTREAARGLARLVDPPGVILTSPKVRAVQTADLLGRVFELKPEVLDVLATGSPQEIIRRLSRRKEESMFLVGHEPTLGELIEQLCTGGNTKRFVVLKKAGCACVEAKRQASGKLMSGRLHWLATPKLLREIGKKG